MVGAGLEGAHDGCAALGLDDFLSEPVNDEASGRLGLADRLTATEAEIRRLSTPEYRASLVGTIGRQPLGN